MKRAFLKFVALIFCISLLSQPRAPRYITGMDILGLNASCPNAPVFIDKVTPGSPADSAGIQAGDRLVSIDGRLLESFRDAISRLRSNTPESVTLQVERQGKTLTFSVHRESSVTIWSRRGLKQLDDGLLVNTDFTDADINELRALMSDVDRATSSGDFVNVFTGHYPANKSLYYPGFELFVWDHGQQVHVGAVEDGPAKRSGIRWGDRIVSVNGNDPRGKSLAQLESLFSSPRPAVVHLVVERSGTRQPYTFHLALASDVLRANGWRMAQEKMVPIWLPDEYVRCFE